MTQLLKHNNIFTIALTLVISLLSIINEETKAQIVNKKIVQSNSDRLIVTTDLLEFERINSSDLNRKLLEYIEGGGEYLIDSLGKPNVPIIKSMISVPNGTKPILKIELGKPVIFRDIEVPPVQMPLMDCESDKEEKFIIDSVTYTTNKAYPNKFAEFGSIMSKRGYKLTDLFLYPYQYNPVTKELIVYPNLTVSVDFKGTRQPIRGQLKSSNVENYIKDRTINGKEVLKNIFFTDFSHKDTKSTSGCEYLIVTHDDFENAANDLKAWKDSIGIETKVVRTSDISSTYESDSDSIRRDTIKSYIKNAYNNWNIVPEYLLLLGGIDYIPTFYNSWGPSDFIYVMFEEPFGYVADIPGFGRLPVNTSNEATTIVNRIIDYESNHKGSSFYETVLGAAYFQEGNIPGKCSRGYAEIIEDILNFMENGLNFEAERVYYAPSHITPEEWRWDCSHHMREPAAWCTSSEPQDFDWDGNYNHINNAINDGTFLVLHRNHGSWNRWSHPNYTNSHIEQLDNDDLRPIVWSINCQTGRFDLSDPNTMCFAENWLIHPTGGGVGVIAASRNTPTWDNHRLIKGLTDAIWPEYGYGSSSTPRYRKGDILDYGRSFNAARNRSLYNYFGDPTMRIFPYNCEPGDIVLSNDILYGNKIVNACKSISVFNYEVESEANLEIYFGQSLDITHSFKVHSGASLTIKPEDIKTGFVK